ncbi:uncharacterized protein LOC130791546 isoform X1 [Actinidia eriantha]|uniref:uncharacterized protein LOC130791546 isoform X1 n=1 Tax=Actinidia eriantha TaxID=165200 RepID=UPI00258589FD|nr:uncharacterized protein LOC130791546 isoform X1 [Actinidia eriantha]XP_057508703.1 uncharacterized protein LOC130791546 isoform X1 [Actinidia eriantha]
MDLWKGTNLLQIIERLYEELKVEQLDVTELTQLEHRLNSILQQTRIRKSQITMKHVTDFYEKRKQLKEEQKFMEKEIAAMINEAAVDDWFSCRHLHDDHHQPPWQDPVVNQEVYAYGSTSNSIVPVAPHHQGAMFYNIGL